MMLCHGIDIVEEARQEYLNTGTLTVSTYGELTGMGYEADVLMAQWESGYGQEDEASQPPSR